MPICANHDTNKKKGFTLEMSIVIVIIGLVVGGVIAGRDLIRAAELRSVQTDWTRFETAARMFEEKYNCIAGDCSKAAQFGLGANGNGNGYIEQIDIGVELWYFWQHLGNAKLIAGAYSGIAGNNTPNPTYDAVAGVNVPASKITRVGYTMYQRFPNAWNSAFGVAGDTRQHFIITGRDDPNDNLTTFAGAFSARELFALDQKADDGISSRGRIRTHANDSNFRTIGCTAGASPNHNYDTTSNGQCNIIYFIDL